MRICILTTSFPRYLGDYAGNFVFNLSSKLVNKKFNVRVVAPHDIKTKNHEFIKQVEIFRFKYWFTKKGQKLAYQGGIPHNINNSFYTKFQLLFFLFFFLLKGLKQSQKSDVIHAQFLLSGFVGVFIKKLNGKKLLITAHGSDIYRIPEKGILKNIFIRLINYSDKIITVSNNNKDILIKLGITKNIIQIIPNGVNLSLFDTPSITNKTKKGIDILWIGRMVEVKGLKYLIKAMKKIVEIHSNTKLILVGDGPIKQNLINLTKELNLENNINFVGFVSNEEIPKYLNYSDIFVLPSISEGLPVSILEAMAASKPVIVSNIRGIPDLVKDGSNGFLVKPKNPEQLAKKLNYLIEHPKERKRMGIYSRKKVEKKFTWDIVVNKTIAVYNNL